jgi:predicted nucleic acid-binding protein
MTDDVVPPTFVDTNILVYALAADDDRRSSIAQEVLRELMKEQALRTSLQVLQELYVTLTRKVRSPLSPQQVLRYMDQIAAWPVIAPDYSAIRAAVAVSVEQVFSFWDSLIVVCAARSGARRLYTEDLQAGRVILGVEVVNPFQNTNRTCN